MKKALLGTAGARIVSLGLRFLSGVILARALGADGLGLYSLAISIISILTVPTEFGLPALVTREVSRARAAKDSGRLKGILNYSLVLVAAVSIFISVTTWGLLKLLNVNSDLALMLIMGCALIPLVAIANLISGALIGFEKILRAQFLEQILRPGLFLLSLFAYWLFQSHLLNPRLALILNITAAFITVLFSIYFIARNLPKRFRDIKAEYLKLEWFKAAMPMALTQGMRYFQGHFAILMLGWFAMNEDVGVFKVAHQLSELILLPLAALSVVVAPFIAKHFETKNIEGMNSAASAGHSWVVAGAVGIAALFFAGGDLLIGLIFGANFSGAYYPLLILVSGNVVSSLFGTAGIVLNMTKNEQFLTRSFLIALLVNITLGFILIPQLGVLGAATSGAASIATLSFLSWLFAKRQAGVNTFFGMRTKYEST